MPRLEGLTPPTVGHGNLCCDNRTHGSPPAHAIAHTYVHPRVQQIRIRRATPAPTTDAPPVADGATHSAQNRLAEERCVTMLSGLSFYSVSPLLLISLGRILIATCTVVRALNHGAKCESMQTLFLTLTCLFGKCMQVRSQAYRVPLVFRIILGPSGFPR
ncbi:hypothetical protein ALC60_01964 [Trachymyrmex zeteki]|uniref:Uncharacterized protein n=1 Tax=Mycetomoellerius zeteki TaxID=64791 RepID=A0A151XFI3_9HYME|nr:hypothetical protein ALC60_01964 [Trachymyrmex zeteki]